jgi:ankyrin repeat/IBR domain-containing protein 1
LYDTAKEKMLVLARAVAENREMAIHETKFIQDAITQLLKARHVLKCSYVYGYFLEDGGYKKPIFEFMQVRRQISSLILLLIRFV